MHRLFLMQKISLKISKSKVVYSGIRPGRRAALFLNEVASRLTLWGSIYLGLISTLPWVFGKVYRCSVLFWWNSCTHRGSSSSWYYAKNQAQMYMNKYHELAGRLGHRPSVRPPWLQRTCWWMAEDCAKDSLPIATTNRMIADRLM